MKVSVIFKDKPESWGLRGDPYFYDELKRHFSNDALPYDIFKFKDEFCKFFKAVTNDELHAEKIYHVKRYESGGMSSGALSGDFWTTMLDRLMQKLNRANAEAEFGDKLYNAFLPMDITDIVTLNKPEKVIFSSNDGKYLLKAEYQGNLDLNVYLDKDNSGFVGYSVEVFNKEKNEIIYLDETLHDKDVLTRSFKRATEVIKEH